MNTRKFSTTIALGLTIVSHLWAQTPTKEVFVTDPPILISTGVSNGITSTINWTKTDANSIITTMSPSSGTSTTITFSSSATDGQEATVRAVATATTSSCTSDPKDLKFIIRTPATVTFKATIATTSQTHCEGETPSDINITFNNNVTGYRYYIDADNSGTLNNSEVYVNEPVANTNSATLDVSSITASSKVIIVSVTGTSGGSSLTSPQSGVSQTITINTKPVITDIQF